MCITKECPLKDKCYRFMATPDKYRQSYANFTPIDGVCVEFWEIENEKDNSMDKDLCFWVIESGEDNGVKLNSYPLPTKGDVMTYEEFIEKILGGVYDSKVDYPTRKMHTQRWRDEKETWEKDNHACFLRFKKDLFSLVGFSTEQCETIFKKAYDDGHAGGYLEITYEFTELADLIKEVMY